MKKEVEALKKQLEDSGALVDSIRATSPLTYIGLGEVVDPFFLSTHVSSTLGIMDEPADWVSMAGLYPRTNGAGTNWPYDVLTGFMSGCRIARWREGGVTYVGHVGTVEADAAANRAVKRSFAFSMPRGTTAFNPMGGSD